LKGLDFDSVKSLFSVRLFSVRLFIDLDLRPDISLLSRFSPENLPVLGDGLRAVSSVSFLSKLRFAAAPFPFGVRRSNGLSSLAALSLKGLFLLLVKGLASSVALVLRFNAGLSPKSFVALALVTLGFFENPSSWLSSAARLNDVLFGFAVSEPGLLRRTGFWELPALLSPDCELLYFFIGYAVSLLDLW
jgi:hypothetical protein